MADLSFAGKTAVVTGSGRPNGIGAAIAIALAKRGASVTVNYVSDSSASKAAEVEKTIKAAGGNVTVVRADMGDAAQAKDLVAKTLSAFKTDKVDILVNNARIDNYTSLIDVKPADLENVFHTNVVGYVNVIQAALPHIPRGGRIINFSSVITKLAVGMPAYGISKAAIDFLSYALASELGESRGITVNTIAPGPTTTDMEPPAGHPLTEHLLSLTRAEKRLGNPEDIANTVLLVASPLSNWITGQYISASGGITGP